MGRKFTPEQLEKVRQLLPEPEEFQILLESDDPVIWGESYFFDPDTGEEPLSVKKGFFDLLRDPIKDRAIRTGRQVGKCPRYDSKIQLADGSVPTAEEIYKNVGENGIFYIGSTDNSSFRHITTKAVITDNGIKPTTEITTKSLFSCAQSSNHPFLIWRDQWEKPKWIPGEDILPGDRIAVTRNLSAFAVDKSDSALDEYQSELLGYLIGDGGTSQRTIKFTSENDELPDRINTLLLINNTGILLNKNKQKYQYTFILDKSSQYFRGIGNVSWITEFVINYGLQGKLSKDKVVPPDIFKSSNKSIAAFLGAYWSTDGWICEETSNNGPQLGVASASKELIHGVRTLLLRLGIQSRIYFKPVKYKDGRNDAWQLIIKDSRYINRFKQLISLHHTDKQSKLDNITLKNNNSNTDTLPKGIWNYVEKKRIEKGWSKNDVIGGDWQNTERLRYNYSPNREKFLRQTAKLEDPFLKSIGSSDIFWDTVKEVKYTGLQQTYAISVPETENLITDNFITHNTVHMCLDILHTAFFNKNKTIFVLVPEKKNMNRMLEIMGNMLRKSVLREAFTMGSKKGKKEDIEATFDYEIKCISGSVIRFFFVKQNPDKIRGQSLAGGALYMDEVEFFPDKAFSVITGFLKSDPNIIIWASSTPSGFTNTWFRKFSDRCLDPNYEFGHEYHLPTSIEDNWPEIEARLREVIFDEITWKLEVLAEWADGIGAVYKKDTIDQAVERSMIHGMDVTMEELRSTLEYENAPKFLGVDWNVPQNGVRLVEISYMYGRHYLTRHETISHELYTQTHTVNRILQLYSLLKYDKIAVDAGFGDVQIELLHQSLVNKGVDVNSVLEVVESVKKIKHKITYTSPETGARKQDVIEARVRNYIVSLVTKFMESSLAFPKEEDTGYDGLVSEVRNFKRKKANQDRGGFEYSENTHSLSALQVVLFGIEKWEKENENRRNLNSTIDNMDTENLRNLVKKRHSSNISASSFSVIHPNSSRRTGGLGGRSSRTTL